MYPKIVIVGRPNVGKSSLLNLLANRRVSIVDAQAGVTRDRVSTDVEIPDWLADGKARFVELVDTGGYGVEDIDDLTAEIERQIAHGVAEASLILFVVDAQTGVMPLDEKVATLLRSALRETRTTVRLVANKVDSTTQEPFAWEAQRLGFGEPIMISATTGHLKTDFLREVYKSIDFDAAEGSDRKPQRGITLALVGKRNAGKSTLVNAMAGDDRVIVSEVEGTTRDSVDVHINFEGREFTAIDTAGVRRRKSVKEDIDYYSHHRSLRSVRRCDVVLLMIDATVPISQVDRQLVNEIVKHFKPTVIVVNKWDLVDDTTQEKFIAYFDDALKGLSFAPLVFISAKKQEGLREVLAMADNLYQQSGHRVGTGELNRVIELILSERTPSSKFGKAPKLYYATQLEVHPPTVALFVNDQALFEGEYERYLINRFREHLPYSEVPIKLLVRPRKSLPKEARLAQDKADEKAELNED